MHSVSKYVGYEVGIEIIYDSRACISVLEPQIIFIRVQQKVTVNFIPNILRISFIGFIIIKDHKRDILLINQVTYERGGGSHWEVMCRVHDPPFHTGFKSICSSGAPTLNFRPKSSKVAQTGLKAAQLAK